MQKNLLQKLIAIALIFIFVFSGFTTAFAADKQDETLTKIQEKGVLTVGLSADYPPYEFHQTIDGKDEIVGFDVSIAKKIAKDLDVKLDIKEMNFDSLLGSLKTGKIDMIISGMSPTPERQKEVDFSAPYMLVQQRVVVRKADTDKFTTVNDFSGVKVGAQKQSTQEELAQKELIGSDVVSLQKVPDLILNLKSNKIDAIVLEGPVAEAYLSQDKTLALADVKFQNGSKETAIALPKGSTALQEKVNTSIKEIQDTGALKNYKKEANKLMFQDGSFYEKYGNYFVKGTLITIALAAIGVLCGAIFGSLLALMKLAKTRWLRWPASCYIEFVRGTPLLIQIFIVFFGTQIIGLDVSAFVSGCIALSLNSAAYVAEIIRAGISAVNKGQMEAARSLGMTQSASMRYIILPQAVKNILPALGNEFVTVIKESSIVSVIGVTELMFMTGVVQGASFKPFIPLVITSLIYFVLTFSLSRLLGVAERRMRTSD
ncbi:ABC transporter permease subunit [Listeria sp. FSL L7-1485]|uniref:ABC transporter permease subunit n=1 Tax=Listeria immobilis TaxID=2713502 RepID=A0A7X0X862_9LIST|nr:ABC transporter permease subunit [Listeria immobilis]MBC1483088.1 ABC transporter permease subunit [Listeria immobilis]MBC1489088.1 ABC transporter permease subunit [Listeria immobilis]MBC1507112.1 ABC transporter permease subunit [Listeria immobilis]MBC1509528.1 ABC transporter permease subunit [Listeria immobilis]MBC1515666.1 ABC transporter permease subunit [Listeria immobilis]